MRPGVVLFIFVAITMALLIALLVPQKQILIGLGSCSSSVQAIPACISFSGGFIPLAHFCCLFFVGRCRYVRS